MSDTETPTKRGKGQPITSANARTLAHKSAEVRRQKRDAREQRAEELKALASLSPRERLRLELPELYATFLERLDEVLHGPDPEAALNQFWKAVDQAYGKTTEQLEVRAGPLDEAELETWSDERIAARLAELDAESEEGG